MESASESRFDPNLAAQLLVDIAHERSLDNVLHKLGEFSMQMPDTLCAQFWLIEKGDLCGTCQHRRGCPDQSRCLHLVGERVRSIPRLQTGLYDRGARFPLGVEPLGSAVTSGQWRFVAEWNKLPAIPVPDGVPEESVRGYVIIPVIFKGEALGAFVRWSREEPPKEARPWARILADHVGGAIANARAFEEIQRLKAQLELRNTYLEEAVVEAKSFGDLVGQSAALGHIVSQIDVVAPTEASVLILGETGTGKELVAHEIHRRSRRKDGPLVRVNCASIPRDLFESEFFGHVRGAFTGAVKDRAGRFETAEEGIIFLDEVGEIPVEIQNKLLRVLQEKRYERVGDDRTRRADVRIVSATNRDLKKAVETGRFREDLYYRLNVFPIQIPPLRKRMEDLPLLAKHFVELSARELKCAKPRLTRAAVEKLQNYSWPGNVRELRNVIERAVILARGGALDFDLPVTAESPPHPILTPHRAAAKEARQDQVYFTEAEMQRRERDNLVAVLEKSGWRIKGSDGAAERLGIKSSTLQSRMKKLGLKPPS